MNEALLQLKQMIKADTEAAQRITKAISKTERIPQTGPERDALWRSKRADRPLRRHRLLAYALLRGVPFAKVEPKTQLSAPDPRDHQKQKLAYLEFRIHLVVRSVLSRLDLVHYSREHIESWLLGRDVTARSEAA